MTIPVTELLEYFPKQHGEHGVDATLHMLAKGQDTIHEVFSNTPGGSWTLFDIIQPSTNEVFRWDHMPRVPEAKRPDWILQLNEGELMNFLVTESKQNIEDIYPDMGMLLIQFFTQSKGFLGIRNRPAWHRRIRLPEINQAQARWTLVSPDEDDGVRFWFKRHDLVKYWTGFVFAFNPEHYETVDDDYKDAFVEDIRNLLRMKSDIQVAIGVGWKGKYHLPFVVRGYSEEFKTTKFASELDKLLSPALLE